MPRRPETGADRRWQELPLETVLGSLRDVLEAAAVAQRRGEEALQRVLDRLDTPASANETPPEDRESDAVPVAVAVDLPECSSAAAEPVFHDSRSPSLASDSDPRLAVRRVLAGLQRSAHEVDRLLEADTLAAYLWQRAQDAGLRGLRLQEKGRALRAEDGFGFAHLDADRQARLRRLVIGFDPDGLFGVTAQERAVYSGPRPLRGLPAELVAIMGHQAPVWCLVVPLPQRNRWNGFLYFDAHGAELEAILELELVARLAVLQLRAARFRPHEPAERVRIFRALTLRDRRQRRERDAQSTSPASLLPPGPDRFDEVGKLVRPLDRNAILARVGRLPSMPRVARHSIALLEDPQASTAGLPALLATDPLLSTLLVQIASSSIHGEVGEVTSVDAAVTRLGLAATRSWLMAAVTHTLFAGSRGDVHRQRLWRQSVLAGIAAHRIAEREPSVDPDAAFLGGLLQNVGQQLLARDHPEVFAAIDAHARSDQRSYFESERIALGFDHADLSALILEKWGLGPELVGAVASHHRLDHAGPNLAFAAVIALAEELALRFGAGPTETSDEDLGTSTAAVLLGLDPDAIEAVADVVAQRAFDRAIFAD